MAEPMKGGDVQTRALALKNYWQRRDQKQKDWYEQIKMVDVLAQRDMESFVGNDPRASFNLISGLLNQPIPHRIPAIKLTPEQVAPAAELSKMFDVIWENINDAYRQRGRYLTKDIIEFLIITGWYAVFAVPTQDGSGFVAEAWNPITVYPRWSDMLSECAHVFTPGASSIHRMKLRNGWEMKSPIADNTIVYDYWWTEQTATKPLVHNSIVINNEQVKPDTVHPNFDRIPIFIAPIGGLPDTGELSKGRRGDDWKADIGQSFIATNENVYKTVNKWWSFMMQLLRDTAQAKTFERTNSAKQIVQPETWNRRGAHYKLGPQDEIGYIQPPAIPVELRSLQLDLEAMEQRGGPNWSSFGSIQNRMTSFAMSQIAAATNQMAKYFHQGVVDLFSDIDNFFYKQIRDNHYKPYGIGLPENLPANVKMIADYELRIPGDLVQRATTARMLNPQFELSDERVMAELFPEIKNPTEEIALVTASNARRNPIFGQISLVEALREEAVLLRNAQDAPAAELYEKAAERLEQQITGGGEQTAQPGQGNVPVRPEVLPPNQPRQPSGEVR